MFPDSLLLITTVVIEAAPILELGLEWMPWTETDLIEPAEALGRCPIITAELVAPKPTKAVRPAIVPTEAVVAQALLGLLRTEAPEALADLAVVLLEAREATNDLPAVLLEAAVHLDLPQEAYGAVAPLADHLAVDLEATKTLL